ncbi:MAG: hypothetical protein K2J39_10840 [Ruminococcus sp.]|nr:hypothetical protein [Ruminococcus sp.]
MVVIFIKNRLIFTITALILIFLTAFTERCISYRKPSDISRIEIEKGEFLFRYNSNCVIDFENNTITSKSGYSYEDNEETIRHFSEEDKENFVSQLNIYGFFSWQDYVNLNVHDDGYTDFLVVYNDGTHKETGCHNAYPDTYDAVWEAIWKLRSNSYEN